VIFDHAGNRLVIGERAGTIRIVNLDNPDDAPQILFAHGFRVYGVALSVDGSTLYTVSADGGLITWSLADGRRIGPPRFPPPVRGPGEIPAATSIDLALDDATAAVGYADGRVIVWDPGPPAWVREACALMSQSAVTAASAGETSTTPNGMCPPDAGAADPAADEPADRRPGRRSPTTGSRPRAC
jgi:hypothetical protein